MDTLQGLTKKTDKHFANSEYQVEVLSKLNKKTNLIINQLEFSMIMDFMSTFFYPLQYNKAILVFFKNSF